MSRVYCNAKLQHNKFDFFEVDRVVRRKCNRLMGKRLTKMANQKQTFKILFMCMIESIVRKVMITVQPI